MKRHITVLLWWWSYLPIQGFAFAPSHHAHDASDGIHHVLNSKLLMTEQDDDQSTVLTKQLCEHWERQNDPEQCWYVRAQSCQLCSYKLQVLAKE